MAVELFIITDTVYKLAKATSMDIAFTKDKDHRMIQCLTVTFTMPCCFLFYVTFLQRNPLPIGMSKNFRDAYYFSRGYRFIRPSQVIVFLAVLSQRHKMCHQTDLTLSVYFRLRNNPLCIKLNGEKLWRFSKYKNR